MTSEHRKYSSTYVSKTIQAPREVIYGAFMEASALSSWLPPSGMTGHIHFFNARSGGSYRMSLSYTETSPAHHGKTTENTDTFVSTFVELVPCERIVQQIVFETDDPAFSGTMTIKATLADTPSGTRVTILCENIPPGIRPEDNEAGTKTSLDNLAAFVEGKVD